MIPHAFCHRGSSGIGAGSRLPFCKSGPQMSTGIRPLRAAERAMKIFADLAPVRRKPARPAACGREAAEPLLRVGRRRHLLCRRAPHHLRSIHPQGVLGVARERTSCRATVSRLRPLSRSATPCSSARISASIPPISISRRSGRRCSTSARRRAAVGLLRSPAALRLGGRRRHLANGRAFQHAASRPADLSAARLVARSLPDRCRRRCCCCSGRSSISCWASSPHRAH